ncbi:MAG: hypothetical protein JWN04_2072, partial [Myxococcaceae bacterium]|nr:hypothetical protein [Myxococcaceae bacterium]
LPTPPLRNIVFAPPLPGPLAAAVRELELGPALKVVSEYSRRFWEDEGQSGLVLTDQHFGVAWSASDSYSSQHGLLTQFVTGAAAHRWSQLPEHRRIEQALRELFVVYPEGKALRAGPAVTLSWVDERYTGGGYAAYAPTQLTRFFPALRKGTARLRFAGEHTEALAGYMESAVRSGHRVARELGSPP